MATRKTRRGDDSRDDADVRGEHVYGTDRTGRKVPGDDDEPVRRPGRYVAGAHGTQEVTGAHERPESKPSARHTRRRAARDSFGRDSDEG